VRGWLASRDLTAEHQGYPVMDGETLVGVLTRRDILAEGVKADGSVRDLVKRAPVVVSESSSLREAADQMVRAGIGRLPVVSDADTRKLVGILTRSDLLSAHKERLDAELPQSSRLAMPRFRLAR